MSWSARPCVMMILPPRSRNRLKSGSSVPMTAWNSSTDCFQSSSKPAGVRVYAGMDPRLGLSEVIAHAQRVERLGYDGLHATGNAGREQIDIPSAGRQPFQFVLEADHFSDCIRNNKTPKTPGELGLKDLESIEALYKAAGTPLA